MAEQETDAVRRLLARLEGAHRRASEPFWDRCGCLAGLGEIPSVSDCHQAGLCSMRLSQHRREEGALRVITAVRAVLNLADEHEHCCNGVTVDRLRAAVAEALRGGECSGCSMPGGQHWDTCPNRGDGRPTR